MIVGCSHRFAFWTSIRGGSGKRFFIPLTGQRVVPPIGTNSRFRMGQPRSEARVRGPTENIAGGLFACTAAR